MLRQAAKRDQQMVPDAGIERGQFDGLSRQCVAKARRAEL
jgi:hypothetical protein